MMMRPPILSLEPTHKSGLANLARMLLAVISSAMRLFSLTMLMNSSCVLLCMTPSASMSALVAGYAPTFIAALFMCRSVMASSSGSCNRVPRSFRTEIVRGSSSIFGRTSPFAPRWRRSARVASFATILPFNIFARTSQSFCFR